MTSETRKDEVTGERTPGPDLSVVVPFFDESRNVNALFDRLAPVLDGLGMRCEVVCVNDGSRDDTLEKLLVRRQADARIVVVDLSRNFGKERALSAGLATARGRAIVAMDADLQHPPEIISDFIAKWREGFDVVYAVRDARRGQGPLQRFFANLFYKLFDRLSEVPIPHGAGDFRLMDRAVVDIVNAMPERNRFMKGIFSWVGFRQTSVPYRQDERMGGTSSLGFVKLVRFAFVGLTAFSNFPLKIWSMVGAAISGVAFCYIIYRLLRVLFYGIDVPGFESIIVAILFLGGVQLLSLGILGDYLGRVFDEVKGRPLYIIRQTYGPEENAERKDQR